MKSNRILLLILNFVLLFIAIYGLWGAFWVWQPGASPPQLVPLLGSYSYLQSMQDRGYNATLVYNFLTYRVDIWIDGVRKLGVTRLDWTQFSLILLVVLDSGAFIYYFLKSQRTRNFFHRTIEPRTDEKERGDGD